MTCAFVIDKPQKIKEYEIIDTTKLDWVQTPRPSIQSDNSESSGCNVYFEVFLNGEVG